MGGGDQIWPKSGPRVTLILVKTDKKEDQKFCQNSEKYSTYSKYLNAAKYPNKYKKHTLKNAYYVF